MEKLKNILFELSFVIIFIIIFLKIWPIFLQDASARYELFPILIWKHCAEFTFGAMITILIHRLKKISFKFHMDYFLLFLIFQVISIIDLFYPQPLVTFFPLTCGYVNVVFQILSGIYFIRSLIFKHE